MRRTENDRAGASASHRFHRADSLRDSMYVSCLTPSTPRARTCPFAYCEIHAAETAITVSATLRRAAQWFREQGCGPVQAVMSDNAKCYARSHAFRATLAELGARHILIPPYTPRWNGKIERFWHTLDSEWAHSRVWPNSTRRDRALASFMRYYTRRRPHSAARGRPPISRVH